MIRKHQNKTEQPGRPNNLLFIGSVILIVAVMATLFYLNTKISRNDVIETSGVESKFSKRESDSKNSKKMIVYKSEMFKYSVSYPDTLTVWEMGSGGGYIDFVRFEETGKSSFKGFAIGVSEQNLDNEVDRIKKTFETENAFFSEETTTNFKNLRARQLYYKPQKLEDGEDRLIVIFNNGQYTYSISTVPWQVNEVLDRFELLK